jgi:hypothetical protein
MNTVLDDNKVWILRCETTVSRYTYFLLELALAVLNALSTYISFFMVLT